MCFRARKYSPDTSSQKSKSTPVPKRQSSMVAILCDRTDLNSSRQVRSQPCYRLIRQLKDTREGGKKNMASCHMHTRGSSS